MPEKPSIAKSAMQGGQWAAAHWRCHDAGYSYIMQGHFNMFVKQMPGTAAIGLHDPLTSPSQFLFPNTERDRCCARIALLQLTFHGSHHVPYRSLVQCSRLPT